MTERVTPEPLRSAVRLFGLLGGAAALVGGTWTGLTRAGALSGHALAASHGPLMALGFLGTVIALERAVGARLRGAWLAPVASASGVLWLVAGGPPRMSGVLFAVTGATVGSIIVRLWWRRFTVDGGIMLAGAIAWTVAGAAWAMGTSPVALAPLLAAFLVLTIIAERLELSRLRQPPRRAVAVLVSLLAAFVSGVALTGLARDVGLALAGGALVAATVWLVRYDIARVTIHRSGLPRFAAAAMLSAYGWLAIGGGLWIVLARSPESGLLADAALHAVFLGFVLAMVFGHAPIILPAVFRIAPPPPVIAWPALVVLHVGVGVRVVADLVGSTNGRATATMMNAAAIAGFALAVAGGAVTARSRRPPDPTTTPEFPNRLESV